MWHEEKQLYLNLLWGRVDSLSSFIGHNCSETGLANGHTMDVECGSVVVKGLVKGAGTEGRAGHFSPKRDLSTLTPRCPVLTPGELTPM